MKCVICGKNFIPNPKTRSQKYCSWHCYTEALKRAKRSGKADNRKNNRPPKNDFLTIPQAPKYEMNSQGLIRNKKTGRILKWFISPRGVACANLYTDGGRITAAKFNLLWLLHGIIAQRRSPVAVAVERGTRYKRFDTLSDCAKFLSSVTHLKTETARWYLASRKTRVADWNITYLKC